MNNSTTKNMLKISELPFSHTTNHFTQTTLEEMGVKGEFFKRVGLIPENELRDIMSDARGGVVFHLQPSRSSQIVLYRFNCLVGESVENLVDSILLFYRTELNGKNFAVAELQQTGASERSGNSIVSLFPITGNLNESMAAIYVSQILTRIDIDPSSNFTTLDY